METAKAFGNIETIKIENPVDKIINQLKNLITTGQLKPGDRLPPERLLAQRFGVGRGYIREAILKLEFYGLIKTSPQSGTYVAGFSLKILDSIFTDIINFSKDDYASMIEARYYMEINAARLAADRRTEDDIVQMNDALLEYDAKINRGQFAVEEDMVFHIKMAAATKNSVLESMIIILIPDLIKVKNMVDKDICKDKNYTIDQHHKILDAIIDKDLNAAGDAMGNHLREFMDIRLSL
ncbi:MAG: FadR family transcriptional regulator [Ferruginibacter sp.]|nr:FadR family transcriptional regulator [Ferruginibacter sp.]